MKAKQQFHKITSKKLDVPLIKQDISCGYAIIEMMSDYYGNKVTEKELYEKNNNGISTSTTNGFVKEINDTIKGKNYNSLSYAKNDELLLAINLAIDVLLSISIKFLPLAYGIEYATISL